MRFIRFHPWHLYELDWRPGDQWDEHQLEITSRFSHATTIAEGGDIVAILGLVEVWTGVATVWAGVSDLAKAKPVQFTKMAKRALAEQCLLYSLRRVEAQVHIARKTYRRWIELLGFQPEYIKQYAAPDGGDIIGYVAWTNHLLRFRNQSPKTTEGCGRPTPDGPPTRQNVVMLP